VYALGNACKISSLAFEIHLLLAQLSWSQEFLKKSKQNKHQQEQG
jgi:hypothetical protein